MLNSDLDNFGPSQCEFVEIKLGEIADVKTMIPI